MLTGTFAQVNVQFSEIFELFLEIDCAEDVLGRIKGNDFICTLLDYLEVTEKQGN